MRRRRPPVDVEAARRLEMLRDSLLFKERLLAVSSGPNRERRRQIQELREQIAEEEARGAQET